MILKKLEYKSNKKQILEMIVVINHLIREHNNWHKDHKEMLKHI